ncbi:MAG: response regulator [Magnetospirillum sp.]|nr:response regulator [Magnetospirillum sp.]
MDEGFTILVVEDSALMRSLVRQMLSQATPCTILDAADGVAALEILRQRGADLVLSDWNMQPMDGLHLLQAMRADPALAEVPFVMMTGEQTPQTIMHAVAAGVAGFLTKPFGREQLARTVLRIRANRIQAA